MKCIIAGSRIITDYSIVKNAIEEAIQKTGFTITEVVSGRAKGVDQLGERWAKENNIPIKPFPAKWYKYGKQAGMLRNLDMGHYVHPDGWLLLIWTGNRDTSPGSAGMLRISQAMGIRYFQKIINNHLKNLDNLV